MLGRRDPRVLRHHEVDSSARDRIAAAMERPALFDSLLRYLAERGYDVPEGELARDVTEPREPSPDVQRGLLDVYRADGEEAQICERLVDLDEGLQEWRYRHVKMVERTIGDKVGTGGSPGAAYLRTALQPGVPGSVGDPERDVTAPAQASTTSGLRPIQRRSPLGLVERSSEPRS